MTQIKLKNDLTNLETFEKKMPQNLYNLWIDFINVSKHDLKSLDHWQKKFKPFGLSFNYDIQGNYFDFVLSFKKPLTKRQKTIEQKRQIKKIISKKIEPMIYKILSEAIDKKQIPKNWMFEKNYSLSKYALNEFFSKNIFEPNEIEKNIFEEIKNS